MRQPRLRQRPQVRRWRGVRLGEGEVLAAHVPGRGRVHRREVAHVQLVDGVVRGLRALHAGAFPPFRVVPARGLQRRRVHISDVRAPPVRRERAGVRVRGDGADEGPGGPASPRVIRVHFELVVLALPVDRADDGPHAVGALGHLGVERGVVAARAVEQPEAHAPRGGRPHANSHRRRVAVFDSAAETGESAARSALDRDAERALVAAEDVVHGAVVLYARRVAQTPVRAVRVYVLTLHGELALRQPGNVPLAHKRLRDARQRVPRGAHVRVPVARLAGVR